MDFDFTYFSSCRMRKRFYQSLLHFPLLYICKQNHANQPKGLGADNMGWDRRGKRGMICSQGILVVLVFTFPTMSPNDRCLWWIGCCFLLINSRFPRMSSAVIWSLNVLVLFLPGPSIWNLCTILVVLINFVSLLSSSAIIQCGMH